MRNDMRPKVGLFFPAVMDVLVAGHSLSYAQGALPRTGPFSDCEAAKEAELIRYIKRAGELHDQGETIKRRANSAKVSCGSNRSCIDRVDREAEAALRENKKQQSADSS